MIRTYCFDTEKDWDEGIHLLLFAVRESVQESLGFSQFELVFGHTVRGPLKLLKETFLSTDDTSLNLLQYVSYFRTRLSKACELAHSNLQSAQDKMKSRYDECAQERNFSTGDKVLALLPIPGKPLQARYYGPYTVEKRLSDLNYIINTPGRRKQRQLCHINMLKKYIDRDSSVPQPVSVVLSVDENANESKDCDTEHCENFIPGQIKLQNSDILQNLDDKLTHLQPQQRDELKQLIHEYEHLFPDVPTRTDKIYHDVERTDSTPIKQHPYRLNPQKQQYLKEEIKYLLDNDFIEPSNSVRSSPCILVPKSDQSYRMCTDYRKVNSKTKSDSFPIPRVDDCIDKVGQAKYVTTFDLLKGFWQIPLTDRAKEVSAMVTPDKKKQRRISTRECNVPKTQPPKTKTHQTRTTSKTNPNRKPHTPDKTRHKNHKTTLNTPKTRRTKRPKATHQQANPDPDNQNNTHTAKHTNTHKEEDKSKQTQTIENTKQTKEHRGAPPWNGQWQNHHWGV